MKVIRVGNLEGTDRDVRCPHGGFTSLRALLAKDGMGFSVHKTIIPPGPPQFWHYKNHLEACYCISGRGTLTEYASGVQHVIGPDTLYVLNNHDRHVFQAIETVILISIFNPPVAGREVHQADGSYAMEVVNA